MCIQFRTRLCINYHRVSFTLSKKLIYLERTMSLVVKGRTAAVTGTGSGIYYHSTKVLQERGCNVVMADLAPRPEANELLKAFPP